MNVVSLSGRFTKENIVEKLGLKIVDYALPQNWLDELCDGLNQLEVSTKPESFYDLVLSSTVYCYDNSFIGYPVFLTLEVFEWIQLYNWKNNSHYGENQKTIFDINRGKK